MPKTVPASRFAKLFQNLSFPFSVFSFCTHLFPRATAKCPLSKFIIRIILQNSDEISTEFLIFSCIFSKNLQKKTGISLKKRILKNRILRKLRILTERLLTIHAVFIFLHRKVQISEGDQITEEGIIRNRFSDHHLHQSQKIGQCPGIDGHFKERCAAETELHK